MNNSITYKNESHSCLSTYTSHLVSSLSKPVDVPIDFPTRKDKSTRPPSGPPSSIWPEPVPTSHKTYGVLPRIEGKANNALPSSPVSIPSNLAQDSATMASKGEGIAKYRSSMIGWHSSQAPMSSIPLVAQQVSREPPPCSSSLLPLTSWGEFPPKQAPEFETIGLTTATAYGKPSNPLPQYLKGSHALQCWMYQKLKDIIQQRKGIELRSHGHPALSGISSISQEDKWLDDLIDELKMARENNEMPEEEPRLVREILDRWSAFVDIKSYESRESTRRYLSGLSDHSRPPPKRALSKTERLLGYDETTLCTPGMSDISIHT